MRAIFYGCSRETEESVKPWRRCVRDCAEHLVLVLTRQLPFEFFGICLRDGRRLAGKMCGWWWWPVKNDMLRRSLYKFLLKGLLLKIAGLDARAGCCGTTVRSSQSRLVSRITIGLGSDQNEAGGYRE